MVDAALDRGYPLGYTAAMDIVIVGGVAGGMSAATRLRRLDEAARITVVERSGNVSFANCGLPYYVGGVIEERDELLLQTPASLNARFALDVRVRTEATAIDRARQVVHIRDLETGESTELHYDALVLSPGARPVTPPIPGIERALALRTVEDADALKAATGQARTAAVIGGGFIGVEVAENLVHLGMQVTLIEATDQVMAPLDPEMVAPVHDVIREAGVDLVLGQGVTAIGDGTVTLADGTEREAELVVAAIGVRPESGLASEAGLAVSDRGAIIVDDQLRTSDPAIYALGDAVVKRDAAVGGDALVPLAGPANRQGRTVADIIMGRGGRDQPVLGTAIVGVFGLQVAASGWNEKRLRAAGLPYTAIHTHPASHAGYYPGAESLSLKLLVDPASQRILGVQGTGRSGVDKRIDVVATAMHAGLTAPELADLELAYAPQFGSAKDPVNMLGWVARDIAEGSSSPVQWHELDALAAAGASIVDVRTPGEFAAGSIPGAVNIPLDELRGRLDDLPAGDLVVYCKVGLRGYLAGRILAQHGRSARNLDGGLRTWLAGAGAGATAPVGVA
jgi:NADPH-dependent 2,4-dienoyl-CoA reductase/sulfur reductase-like enzyme/rhodanese-related sulfurtransferase